MADYNSAYTGEQIDAAVGNAKTAADLKTAYESNADTNAFTDAEKSTLANQSGTNTGDQDISGIATNASAISTLDVEVVKKSDYTPSHSILVQQSGTGAPTALTLSDSQIVGKNGANIKGLSATEVRTIINVEDGADVTDTANVTSAGALMDSEVVNLDQVKNFDSADYATAAQGALADSALQSGDNVSELTNDAGYLTDALQSGDNVSELVNDLGYLTATTGQKKAARQTLTDGASVDWNAANGNIATLTLGGNRTINAPTNLYDESFILFLKQDATGSRTVTWNTVFKWSGGTAPTLSTTANAVDIITFVYDGTNLYGSMLPNFS